MRWRKSTAFFVYHTDESRSRHFQNADSNGQPAVCREAPDFRALEKEETLVWESAVVKEMTLMIVADLIGLAALHKGVICEGGYKLFPWLPMSLPFPITVRIMIFFAARASAYAARNQKPNGY